MQDGHRGQQSFILDGSNVGLGDEMALNGGFDTDSVWDSSDDGWSISDGKARCDGTQTGSGQDINQDSMDLSAGTTYKITADITVSAGNYKLIVGGTTNTGFINEAGSIVKYLTPASVNEYIHVSADADFVGTVDNYSIKPVNAKNHATTAFYGDELNTQANAVTPEHSSASQADDYANWTNSGMDNFGSQAANVTQGDRSLRMTVGTDGDFAHTNFTTTIVGRTYRFKWDRRILNHAADDRVVFKIGTSADNNANGELDSWASNEATTSVVGEYKDFVATATTTFFTVREAGDTHASDVYLDNLSLMEVGTATGWTDADQQLDIPQTALQSYNQLAWFDGVGDHVQTDTNPNWADGSWTCSAWVFVGWDTDTDQYIVRAEGTQYAMAYIANNIKPYIKITDGSGSVYPYSNTTVPFGKWTHLVWKHDDSANTQQIYMNGEKLTMSAGSNTVNVSSDGGDTFLGSSSAGTTSPGAVDGSINEISIWGKAFSDSEAQELYDDGKPLDATLHSAYIATPGDLKGYWRNNGLSAWVDESDNSNDGTPTNITETILIPAGVDSSRDNQGFLMNRQKATNSLNLPNQLNQTTYSHGQGVLINSAHDVDYGHFDADGDGTGDFTIECWVKYDYAAASHHSSIFTTLMHDGAGPNNYAGFEILVQNNGSIAVNASFDDAWIKYVAVGTEAGLNDGEWHHIVGVFDRSANFYLIVDKYVRDITVISEYPVGHDDAGTDLTGKSLWKFPIQIGAEKLGGSYSGGHGVGRTPYDGEVDDLRIYNRVLTFDTDGSIAADELITSGEVLRNYNAGKRSHR